MNTNKAVDEERFQVEFFKHDLHALDSHLANLFNHVVCTGFPSTWLHHIIYSIHKSHSRCDNEKQSAPLFRPLQDDTTSKSYLIYPSSDPSLSKVYGSQPGTNPSKYGGIVPNDEKCMEAR
jgi:hypothetical protein